MPLSAIYFQSVSLIAPLSNLLTLWAVGVLFGAGVLIGTLGVFVPELAALVALPIAPWGVPERGDRRPVQPYLLRCHHPERLLPAWLVLVYLI